MKSDTPEITENRPFRVGDRVTVLNWMPHNGRPSKGRVICKDRRSRYGEPIIVLVDYPERDCEMAESFMLDGTKYLPGNNCRIQLGWKAFDDYVEEEA